MKMAKEKKTLKEWGRIGGNALKSKLGSSEQVSEYYRQINKKRKNWRGGRKKEMNGSVLKRCAYCGVIAEARDHVVPISFNQINRKRAFNKKQKDNLVETCTECNTIAGDKIFSSLDSNRPAWPDIDYNELKDDKKILKALTSILEKTRGF